MPAAADAEPQAAAEPGSARRRACVVAALLLEPDCLDGIGSVGGGEPRPEPEDSEKRERESEHPKSSPLMQRSTFHVDHAHSALVWRALGDQAAAVEHGGMAVVAMDNGGRIYCLVAATREEQSQVMAAVCGVINWACGKTLQKIPQVFIVKSLS